MSEWASVDAFCAYRAKPGDYLSDRKAESKVVKTVNRHGFISTPEIDFAKEPNELRIVFLGESSTAGTGYDLSDVQTWPWQTIDKLRERFSNRKITFINAALPGYSSFESLGRLSERVRFFSPDIVVVDHGWNEMYYFADATKACTWRVHSDGSWGFDSALAKRIEPMWLDDYIGHSQLLARIRWATAHKLEGEVGADSAKSTDNDRRWDRAALDVWRANLRLLRDTSKSIGAEIFVCRQPTLIVPDLPAEERKRCQYHLHHFGHSAHVSAFNAIYKVIDDEIPADHVIDLTALSGKPELFFDHVHPTVEGATKIAALVAERLTEHLK
jgi:lysophospholipase L1-like esterase